MSEEKSCEECEEYCTDCARERERAVDLIKRYRSEYAEQGNKEDSKC